MDPAQERRPNVMQMLGDRLVGGQHELFDDLVADIIFQEVGAANAALFVEF